MIKTIYRIKQKQDGFSIVELMIALSIFTTILLLSSVVLIRLGLIFTKGTNQASVQNVARTLVDDISTQLSFSSAAPLQTPVAPPGISVVCFGTSRYTFSINDRTDGSDADHGLWRDTINTGSVCEPNASFKTKKSPDDSFNPSGNGLELLPTGMRITQFDLVNNGDSYTVTVTVAYAEDDLINFTPASYSPTFVPSTTSCKSDSGSQYCAFASLSRTVSRRIAN